MVSMGPLMADVCFDAHNFHVQKTLLDLWSSHRTFLQHDSIILLYSIFLSNFHHFPSCTHVLPTIHITFQEI